MITFPWSDLSDEEFEELCKDILRAEGLENVQRLSGPGSGDMGRDLHAEESFFSKTGATLREKILVQAKNYWGSKTTISPSDIDKLWARAKSLSYNRALIITSHDLSSPAKTHSFEISSKPEIGVRVDYWNEFDLVDKLVKDSRLMKKFFNRPVIKYPFLIGILSGYIEGSEREISPQLLSTKYSVEDWLAKIALKDKIDVEKIHIVQINKKYDAIINPFGEVYPEENYDEKRTYNKIKNYIYEGGTFINAGGYPFFYCWDSLRGNREIALNIQRVVQTPEGLAIGHLFSDTLVFKDFRALLSGLPATELEVFQTPEDITKIGDLVDVGGSNKVIQFRAVRPETPNSIPLLRGKDNILYPIAAIPYGKGHLIIGGMHIVSNSEFEKLSLCIQNWVRKSVT